LYCVLLSVELIFFLSKLLAIVSICKTQPLNV
jgi:hypothetical protein